MSRIDETFVKMCTDILDHGYSTEGQEVRARWADGTPAHTIKLFGIVNRYDLSEEMPGRQLQRNFSGYGRKSQMMCANSTGTYGISGKAKTIR